MEESSKLNQHNKQEYPPMHTTEHIFNQTMVSMFGCPRSRNSHIERKKSKCDYILSNCPTVELMEEVENRVNNVIKLHLPVIVDFINIEEAQTRYDLGKLPDDVSDTLRIVKIGDFDACPCIGEHVDNTSEIPQFKIISYDYNDNILRIRFKLIG